MVVGSATQEGLLRPGHVFLSLAQPGTEQLFVELGNRSSNPAEDGLMVENSSGTQKDLL